MMLQCQPLPPCLVFQGYLGEDPFHHFDLEIKQTALEKLETRADERERKTEGERRETRGKSGLQLWKVVIDIV